MLSVSTNVVKQFITLLSSFIPASPESHASSPLPPVGRDLDRRSASVKVSGSDVETEWRVAETRNS